MTGWQVTRWVALVSLVALCAPATAAGPAVTTELWLALAEEARRGDPSSLFSQASASATGSLRTPVAGASPERPGAVAPATASPRAEAPAANAASAPSAPPRQPAGASAVAPPVPEEREPTASPSSPADGGAADAPTRERTETAPETAPSSEAGAPAPSGEPPVRPEPPAISVDDLPPVDLESVGLPLRFYLGMLASVGLLVVAGLLWWSASRPGGGT
jgi:hypothetical protein